MTISPPMPRRRTWRPISSAASRLTLRLVSSRPVEAVKLPEFTSIAVSASVPSMVIQPPEGSGTRGLDQPLDLVFELVEVEQHAGPVNSSIFASGFRHGAAAIGARGFDGRRDRRSARATVSRVDLVAHRALDGIEIVIERRRRARALALAPARAARLRRGARHLPSDRQASRRSRRCAGYSPRRARARRPPSAIICSPSAIMRARSVFVFDAARQRDAGLVRHQHQQAARGW